MVLFVIGIIPANLLQMRISLKPVTSVSVVIPCYNYGHYLSRAVNSVLEQTCPVSEIIIVDDGSQDNTREVAAGFGDRVRYIYQQKSGVSIARNAGIRAAQGEWIGFLDADDAWLPHKSERVQQAIREHPDVAMFYHPLLYIQDGKEHTDPVLEPDALWPTFRHFNMVSNGSAALVRRSVLLQLGGFDQAMAPWEDWDMWARVALQHPVYKLPEILAHAWLHPASHGSNWLKSYETSRRIVKTLSQGLTGVRRWWFRQHFLAYRAFDCSMELRATDRGAARMTLFQSLRDWPSPFYIPRRWWAFVLTLAGRV